MFKIYEFFEPTGTPHWIAAPDEATAEAIGHGLGWLHTAGDQLRGIYSLDNAVNVGVHIVALVTL
jgi:hypothetical protein